MRLLILGGTTEATALARRIAAVVDATHPFAAQMSRNAAIACGELAIPLAMLTRPAWRKQAGDRWISVADMKAAVRALGEAPRRVFLTVGALQLAAFAAAPHHHYLARAIDHPHGMAALPSHKLILARGPFSVEDEMALMEEERIEVLVTKNSGGAATEAKIAAARTLGVEVVMVERPATEDARSLYTVEAVLAWIADHRPAP